MNRVLFYLFYYYAVISKLFSQSTYDKWILKAHRRAGVVFKGMPEYIDHHSHLDSTGGLTISGGAVISTNVIILTHDWSFLRGLIAIDKVEEYMLFFNKITYNSVSIGENSFIGAGVVILPGTKIGKLCIIGAGAVVKGDIPDYSVVVGNPCRIISDTRQYGEKIIGKLSKQ